MQTINILGSNLSGIDGTTGRTYTIGVTVSGSPMIQLDNQTLIPYTDYIYNTTNTLITFNVPILDVQYITIYYNESAISGATGVYYTTPGLVQSELRASTTFSTSTIPTLAQLNTWIDEESRIIESITDEVYTTTIVSNVYVDYDGDSILRFPHTPLISISKVEYNTASAGNTPSWVEFSEGDDKNYLAYLNHGEIEFVNGTQRTVTNIPLPGKKKFRLSYTYGYSNIPLDIQRLATLMVTKRVIMSLLNSQSSSEGGNIQIGTISITDPTSYGINYLKSLNNEIDELLSKTGRKFSTHRQWRVY
mgnify:CR=1 FL=1